MVSDQLLSVARTRQIDVLVPDFVAGAELLQVVPDFLEELIFGGQLSRDFGEAPSSAGAKLASKARTQAPSNRIGSSH